jgi:hypothetical protein
MCRGQAALRELECILKVFVQRLDESKARERKGLKGVKCHYCQFDSLEATKKHVDLNEGDEDCKR